MHIAICDDNVADRKQLERLLKRESDKRASTTGVLYVDSYGNSESLLKNPMQYNAFFIDMCKGGITGIDVLNSLTSLGSGSPVILCCSDINYREYEVPSRVIFLDKPIKTARLSEVLDRAQEIADSVSPVIELREEKGTYYVEEQDILYAVEAGRYVHVFLTSGQQVSLVTTALNFFAQVENHISFFSPTPKTVLNGRHIAKIAFHKITMSDGKTFRASGKIMEYAKYLFSRYHEGQDGSL